MTEIPPVISYVHSNKPIPKSHPSGDIERDTRLPNRLHHQSVPEGNPIHPRKQILSAGAVRPPPLHPSVLTGGHSLIVCNCPSATPSPPLPCSVHPSSFHPVECVVPDRLELQVVFVIERRVLF
ncbi:hypothetical protein TNCV_3662241 [Trichonephila clavipes]|nr:hypothetical protein TNCV_3662241 [Trichonephila clavipes]